MLRSNPLRALFAEFHKLSPSLDYECSEDEARHRWASAVLKKPVTTWKTLRVGELQRLIRVAREQSGSGPAYRARLIAQVAVELLGSDWDEFLRRRLVERFNLARAQDLEPAQAHEMLEELISRLVRAHGEGIEAVRARIRKQNAPGRAGAGDKTLAAAGGRMDGSVA